MGDVDRTLAARRRIHWECSCGCQRWNIIDSVDHAEIRCDECGGEPMFPIPLVLLYRKTDNDN